MSQPTQPLPTTTGSLAAVRVKTVNKQIFRALLSIASAALLIRVAGLFNQVVISSHFGAGAIMDAFFVASTLPTLMGQLIVSAIEASVIPVYSRIRAEGSKEQAYRLFSTLLNLLLVGAILLTLLILIFRQQMILFSAPALDPFRQGLAVDLTPFIFPSLFIMVIIGYLECILNTEGQFGWPAYAGILVPLSTAVLVVMLGNFQGVVILCIGTLLGQCLQLSVIILRARRAGLKYRPIIDLHNPAISLILAAAWPVLVGAFIDQGSPLVDQIFASFLSPGSISALSYALKLVGVFTGVIFVSVGRAALPYLSRQVAKNDMKVFKATLRLYLWAIGIGTTILAAFVLVFSHPLVQLFFQRGVFSVEDTNRTATTLIGFVIGLTPMALGFILAMTFNALGKNRVLMYVTSLSVVANALFDYIFARLWQSFGIALATSAVYFCTMFILLFTLRRIVGKLDFFTLPGEVMKTVWTLRMDRYVLRWVDRKEEVFFSFGLPFYLGKLGQQLARLGLVCAAFALGIIGVLVNYSYALRATFGSLVILAFLRYRYALLITWVLINAFIGSSLPIFNGNNLVSGLTIPTILLLFCIPIQQTVKRMPALLYFLIYLLWAFASIGISAIGVGSFLTLWTIYLDYLLVSALTINILSTRRRLLILIDAIIIIGTLISLYGIYGYLTKQNGIQEAGVSSLFRISSIFDVPPTLSLFLSIIIPLSVYRTLTLQGLKGIYAALATFILLAALGLTFTRGAYIGIVVGIIVLISFLPSRKLKIGVLASFAALGAFIVLVAIVGHIPIFTRFFSEDVATLNGRTYLWQAVLDHFDPTQLLGNGLSASNVLLTQLQVGSFGNVIATAPHNIFLAALYDHGVIGASLLVLVFIALVINLIRGWRKAVSREHRILYAAVLGILASVLVQSLESGDFWIQSIGIYFWIAMALPFALCWSQSKHLIESGEEIFDKFDEVTERRVRAIRL